MKKSILIFMCVLLVMALLVLPAQASETRISELDQTVFFHGNAVFILKNDNSLWAWGDNSTGDIGNGKGFESYYDFNSTKWIKPFVDDPYKVLDNVWQFDGSGTWAIKNDHSLWVWGHTAVELGIVSDPLTAIPQKFMDDVISFSVSQNPQQGLIAYAVKSDGTLLSWGKNTFGELGNGNREEITSPTELLHGVQYVQYAYRRWREGNADPTLPNPGCTFAIKADNSLWVWGYIGEDNNSMGISGTNNSRGLIERPIKILDDVKRICNMHGTVAVITNDENLYVWGEIPAYIEGACSYSINRTSNFGTSSSNFYYLATPYLLASNVKSVDVAIHKLCYVTTNGDAYCWGWNGDAYDIPTKVMSNVAELATDT